MSVRDLWIREDGQRTARYGVGKRWDVGWTGPSGQRHRRAFSDRALAERFAADLQATASAQATTAAGLNLGLGLLQLIRSGSAGPGSPGALAAELFETVPPGQHDHALQVALDVVAAATTGRSPGVWQHPGTSRGGRTRTTAQAKKDAQALALHQQGDDYTAISRALGWKHRSSAFAAVHRALADEARNPAALTSDAQPATGPAAA